MAKIYYDDEIPETSAVCVYYYPGDPAIEHVVGVSAGLATALAAARVTLLDGKEVVATGVINADTGTGIMEEVLDHVQMKLEYM